MRPRQASRSARARCSSLIALGISFSEHREFLATLRARANFVGTVKFPQADDDGEGPIATYITTGTGGQVIIEVGLKNNGQRAATVTVFNLVVPAWAKSRLRWTGARGEELGEPSRVAPTDELLIDPTGATTESVYLALELPRVARRPHYVKFAALQFDVPVGGQRWIPIRFTAQADELPDDVEELSLRRTLRILHASHPDAQPTASEG